MAVEDRDARWARLTTVPRVSAAVAALVTATRARALARVATPAAPIPTRRTVARDADCDPRPLARRILSLGIALGVLMPVIALTPQPVAAGSCTGWDSRVRPPESIRVLRTGTGAVERVDFYRYVAIVMASGEWPTWVPYEALEAGAVAAKQFAWYYALEGHHRSWYRTASGACYDVRDDTNDQLYRPERADPTDKQYRALNSTWGLSLRKNDRFFLTGYRAGADVPCGADRDGWKLYAKSIMDCAEKGMTRHEIQVLYYKPNIRFVWADGADPEPPATSGTPPTVTAPKPSVRTGSTLGEAATVVRWTGSDSDGSVVRYELQRSRNGGSWSDVALSSATATRRRVALAIGDTYRFRVRARDDAGNWSTWAAGPTFTPVLHQERSSAVGYSNGTWTTVAQSSASGGYIRRSDDDGAAASLAFEGRSIGVVARRGPAKGTVQVFLDGTLVAEIDLYSATAQPRRVIWHSDFAGVEAHRVTVAVVGGEPVDVDAFLVLR